MTWWYWSRNCPATCRISRPQASDTGDAITADYAAPYPFSGGAIGRVSFRVPMGQDIDTEAEAESVLARD